MREEDPGYEVQPMENMEAFVKENDIDIAVLTIPKTCRWKCGKTGKLRHRAIWNFAMRSERAAHIQVENVHLSESR